MSNVGLELGLAETKIDLVRCAVGDKYVMEEMLNRGLALGGEQSGHVIFSEYLFTGDGLCTALNVLRTMALTGRSLADLAADLVTYPQVLQNVRVREKVDVNRVPPIANVIAHAEQQLAGPGRLLHRYSSGRSAPHPAPRCTRERRRSGRASSDRRVQHRGRPPAGLAGARP